MMNEAIRVRKAEKIPIPLPNRQKAGSKMSAYNKSKFQTLFITEFFNSLGQKQTYPLSLKHVRY